uniref:Ribosomal RNA small subunit methyltransferase A n=2 Tax=Candidatus Bipolaricaulota TaxID=67810 RepID=H5SF94_9BACT|nr:dimethyladenosine transferase [uncultured Acetothermia bacterium]BAL58590.1 dimethyladenosine transferase [Candidatus Acetothermum autotrophicum]
MSLTRPSYIRDILAQHKIRLKKSLGQHFLVDENILKKIAEAAQLSPEDTVVEIGAGVGTLTQELAQRAGRVIAVEIDSRLIPLLTEHLRPYANVVVVQQDFLQFDLHAVAPRQKLAIVGNLPYNVTAPILEKLVEAHKILKSATLLVQLEVAEKLCATPGTRDASAITIFVQGFAAVHKLFSVSRNVFFPKPEVDSALVRLEFYEHPKFRAPEELFLRVVRAAFNLRRKTIKHALTRSPLLALPHELVLEALQHAQIDPQRRGETLSLEEFDKVAQALARLRELRNCAIPRSR